MTFYKFLAGNLASEHDNGFYYAAPVYDVKKKTWKPSPWVTCPKPDRKTKNPCSEGLHLMKVPIPRYVRWSGNCYIAEGRELLAEDEEKARFVSVRLLRPVEFKEIFHPKANLSGADLYGTNLSRANLSEANLYGTNLSEANLSRANLSEALNGNFSDEQLKQCYRKPNGDENK